MVLGYHFIPKIKWGSFRGRREDKWGSFRGRYHFGVDLGIISGLGIVSGSGSFRGLYRSLDIRSPGVFTETFLDHYQLDICKSNAKTHKIISINRFGITCCYFSSRNMPTIALFAATFLSNLVLSRSNQCFGCGLDQSHCRKLHIQI